MTDFFLGLAAAVVVLGAAAVAAFFVLRRSFERASSRVADHIGRILGELSRQATTGSAGVRAGTRTGAWAGAGAGAQTGRFTRLGAYAAAEGISEEAARREFAESIERIARIMDGAVRVPVLGPVGLDAVLGLFPIAGDILSGGIAVTLIARSIKYGIPPEIIARMLANVLVDVVMGAVPVVGDLADIWFRANVRNVQLLREYLNADARDVIDVTPR